mmetsp:Transcript_68912/g.151936  ORF Transcript_68912/g.151936 Transcript_68912/m.151936 type:complete len:98 (+) Transcript_68912:680-973(+)
MAAKIGVVGSHDLPGWTPPTVPTATVTTTVARAARTIPQTPLVTPAQKLPSCHEKIRKKSPKPELQSSVPNCTEEKNSLKFESLSKSFKIFVCRRVF